MFRHLENAVNDINMHISWQKAEAAMKPNPWRKFWDSNNKTNSGLSAEAYRSLVGSESFDAMEWCRKNEWIPDRLMEEIRKMYPEASQINERGKLMGKVYAGTCAALAVMRKVYTGKGEGFILWPDDMRKFETSILKLFNLPKYPNYDDFEFNEVKGLHMYTNLKLSEGFYIDNDILKEAFLKVQGDEPKWKLNVNIHMNTFSIVPNIPDGITENSEEPIVESPKTTPSEEPMDNSKKEDNIVVDCEIGEDGVARPVHEEEEKEKPINFVHDADKFSTEKPSSMDENVYNTLEKFIKDTIPGKEYRYYTMPTGLFQIEFANGSAMTIDPGIIAGNGVNVIGNIKSNQNGVDVYGTIMVNMEMDPDIVAKIIKNPSYVLTPDEYQRALSRLFINGNIYSFVDMSGMSDKLKDLQPEEFLKLGKKLTCITNIMTSGIITPSRLRFSKFDSIDSFNLISDREVKVPLPGVVNTVTNIGFRVEKDDVSVYSVSADGKKTSGIYKFSIEYGEF